MAGRQLLDTRSDAKLESFNGKRPEFEAWAFLFESYAHLLGWGAMVDYARVSPDPIVHTSLAEEARNVNGDL